MGTYGNYDSTHAVSCHIVVALGPYKAWTFHFTGFYVEPRTALAEELDDDFCNWQQGSCGAWGVDACSERRKFPLCGLVIAGFMCLLSTCFSMVYPYMDIYRGR